MYTLIIDGFHLGLFRANFSNKLNSIRNPTGRGQNSWLCKSAAKELNKILPRTNAAGGQSWAQTWDLQISSPDPSCWKHWLISIKINTFLW